jgi:probable rRNA maturation factor
MPDISCDIVLESELWPDERIMRKLTGRVKAVLEGHMKGHIDFVFSDDSMVHVLNREWRGKDKPTNVLSFPDGDEVEGKIHLGDVILAHETITREAEELGVPFDDHLTHLLIHGCLHLVGYDHMTEEEAKVMESLEIQLLASLGIKDPYQGPPIPLD